MRDLNGSKFSPLANKRILLTGHTGFTGSWASIWLKKLGAEVFGYALEPNTSPNLYHEANVSDFVESHIGDIRDKNALSKFVRRVQPEYIIHLAAQPLVRRSYRIPAETFEVNVQGTINVLDASLEQDSVRGVVCVTTDKVYKNLETAIPFTETDELGGKDPYSASKAAAELAIASYRDSFFRGSPYIRPLIVARGGNIVGGGDWSEDRLIPDYIRAWQRKTPLEIRSPKATRPWQHVLSLIDGYVKIITMMINNPSNLSHAYNFGPAAGDNLSVSRVIAELANSIPGIEIQFQKSDLSEALQLRLNSSLANVELGWRPPWDSKTSIVLAADWYKNFYAGKPALDISLEQISLWEKLNGN